MSTLAEEDLRLFEVPQFAPRTRPRGQVLKWVGNKFRHAEHITSFFPDEFGTYFEPFVGTGAVAATLAPRKGVAGDAIPTLVDLLRLLAVDMPGLLAHYDFWREAIVQDGVDAYHEVRDRYNAQPNAADLLILSRTCYGGIMRFTRAGTISTPMGPHSPMATEKLAQYVREWRARLQGVEFVCQDFEETMAQAGPGDLVYCDPPYVHGQAILYGAQAFDVQRLWEAVDHALARGAHVVVSIDGHRRSGEYVIELGVPDGLFQREVLVDRGGCMLRRFQLGGASTADEGVADRLLLSW